METDIVLWTTYYKLNDPERNEEFLKTLEINCNNPHLSKIVVLCENIVCPLVHPKLIYETIAQRPDYNMFFGLYRKYSTPQTVNILANGDIILNYDDTPLYRKIKENELFSLTRYELSDYSIKSYDDITKQSVRLFLSDANDMPYFCSADTFVTKGYPPLLNATVMIGIPGCENHMAYIMRKTHIYRLVNPCLTLRTYHLHKSLERPQYNTEYNRLHAFILPTVLYDTTFKPSICETALEGEHILIRNHNLKIDTDKITKPRDNIRTNMPKTQLFSRIINYKRN
jgi:hypothetical protein